MPYFVHRRSCAIRWDLVAYVAHVSCLIKCLIVEVDNQLDVGTTSSHSSRW